MNARVDGVRIEPNTPDTEGGGGGDEGRPTNLGEHCPSASRLR